MGTAPWHTKFPLKYLASRWQIVVNGVTFQHHFRVASTGLKVFLGSKVLCALCAAGQKSSGHSPLEQHEKLEKLIAMADPHPQSR